MQQFSCGDYVSVRFPVADERKKNRISYLSGKIVQITPRLIIIRISKGYCTAVSRNDLQSGVKIKLIRKGAAAGWENSLRLC